MNDADDEAFGAWTKKVPFQERTPKLAWQAACEWRDSQVGEPIAWCNYNPLTGEKWYSDSKECVNAEPLYANVPIAENQKAVGKFVWIETCDGGYWHHLYKGNEPPSKSKTVFLYAAPPTAQINQQLVRALELAETEMRYAGWGTPVADNSGLANAYEAVVAALAAAQMRGDA